MVKEILAKQAPIGLAFPLRKITNRVLIFLNSIGMLNDQCAFSMAPWIYIIASIMKMSDYMTLTGSPGAR